MKSRPTFAAKELRTNLEPPRPHNGTRFEEVIRAEEEEDNDGSGNTIDPGDLQEHVRDELEVLATCMDNGENDATIPGVDALSAGNGMSETCGNCLKPLPSFQAARRSVSDSHRHSRVSPGGKGETPQTRGRQRVHSSTHDQRHHDDRPALGRAQRAQPQPQQRRGTDSQAKLDK